ncbi:MAG: thioredoxin [Acidimicrobiia bacterium]|nr:thioredoxin [Acidimicrobiia bacterium]
MNSGSHVRDVSTEEFPTAVLQRSREVPVVVDFWAAWCGPCKVLGPVLEKVAEEMGGAFELVKVDVDQNQELAASFGVQGIPFVIAFRDGVPVDQFTGALPETSVRTWIDNILPTATDGQVDEARGAIVEGDTEAAKQLLWKVLDEAPDHHEAGTILAGLLISEGNPEDALILLGKLAPTPEVDRLQAAARLNAAQSGDVNEFKAAVEADPNDAPARLVLARHLAGRGEFEPALDHMLLLVRNRDEHADEARLAMLDVFGVLGNDHPLTLTYRKQLASALF